MSPPSRPAVRDLLNEIRWHPDRDPKEVRVYYADRDAPGGFAVVRGDEVDAIGRSRFTVRETTIPFYKVFRITHGDEVLLEREVP